MQPFTQKDVEDRLMALRSASTAKQYIRNLKPMIAHFVGDKEDVSKGLSQTDEILNYILTKHQKPSTRKNHIASYQFVLEQFGYPAESIKKVKELGRDEFLKGKIDEDENLRDHSSHRPKSEAVAIFKDLEAKYKLARSKMGKDYDKNRMIASFLYLCLNYGVLRANELYEMQIADGDVPGENHINLAESKIVVRKHKTINTAGVREFPINATLVSLVRPGVGGYFLYNGKPDAKYANASGAERMVRREVGYILHEELRKAKVSNLMNQPGPGQIRKLRTLAHIHGHDIPTMSKFYYKYSLKDPKPQPGDKVEAVEAKNDDADVHADAKKSADRGAEAKDE